MRRRLQRVLYRAVPGPVHVSEQVIGLHGGDDAEFGEARDVGWIDDLGVFDRGEGIPPRRDSTAIVFQQQRRSGFGEGCSLGRASSSHASSLADWAARKLGELVAAVRLFETLPGPLRRLCLRWRGSRAGIRIGRVRRPSHPDLFAKTGAGRCCPDRRNTALSAPRCENQATRP